MKLLGPKKKKSQSFRDGREDCSQSLVGITSYGEQLNVSIKSSMGQNKVSVLGIILLIIINN